MMPSLRRSCSTRCVTWALALQCVAGLGCSLTATAGSAPHDIPTTFALLASTPTSPAGQNGLARMLQAIATQRDIGFIVHNGNL
jgi:hypothetical protein